MTFIKKTTLCAIFSLFSGYLSTTVYAGVPELLESMQTLHGQYVQLISLLNNLNNPTPAAPIIEEKKYQISVNIPGGTIIKLSVLSSNTIAEIKQKIFDQKQIAVADQILKLAIKTLEDTKTLAEYDITKTSSLNLTIKKGPDTPPAKKTDTPPVKTPDTPPVTPPVKIPVTPSPETKMPDAKELLALLQNEDVLGTIASLKTAGTQPFDPSLNPLSDNINTCYNKAIAWETVLKTNIQQYSREQLEALKKICSDHIASIKTFYTNDTGWAPYSLQNLGQGKPKEEEAKVPSQPIPATYTKANINILLHDNNVAKFASGNWEQLAKITEFLKQTVLEGAFSPGTILDDTLPFMEWRTQGLTAMYFFLENSYSHPNFLTWAVGALFCYMGQYPPGLRYAYLSKCCAYKLINNIINTDDIDAATILDRCMWYTPSQEILGKKFSIDILPGYSLGYKEASTQGFSVLGLELKYQLLGVIIAKRIGNLIKHEEVRRSLIEPEPKKEGPKKDEPKKEEPKAIEDKKITVLINNGTMVPKGASLHHGTIIASFNKLIQLERTRGTTVSIFETVEAAAIELFPYQKNDRSYIRSFILEHQAWVDCSLPNAYETLVTSIATLLADMLAWENEFDIKLKQNISQMLTLGMAFIEYVTLHPELIIDTKADPSNSEIKAVSKAELTKRLLVNKTKFESRKCVTAWLKLSKAYIFFLSGGQDEGLLTTHLTNILAAYGDLGPAKVIPEECGRVLAIYIKAGSYKGTQLAAISKAVGDAKDSKLKTDLLAAIASTPAPKAPAKTPAKTAHAKKAL